MFSEITCFYEYINMKLPKEEAFSEYFQDSVIATELKTSLMFFLYHFTS